MTNSPKQTPVATRRIGLIEASIWRNTGEEDGKVTYQTTIKRSYFDGKNYQDASGFGHMHLLAVQKLAEWAFNTTTHLTETDAI